MLAHNTSRCVTPSHYISVYFHINNVQTMRKAVKLNYEIIRYNFNDWYNKSEYIRRRMFEYVMGIRMKGDYIRKDSERNSHICCNAK